MNCKDFEYLIALYVEDDLHAREAAEVELHIASCPSCKRFAEEIQESQAALRIFSADDFDDAVLNELRRSVMNQISLGHGAAGFWSRLFNRFRWQYAVATTLVAVLALSASLHLAGRLDSNQQMALKGKEPTKSVELPSQAVIEQKPERAQVKRPKRNRRAPSINSFENLTAALGPSFENNLSNPLLSNTAPVPEVAPEPLPEELSVEAENDLPVEQGKIKVEIQTSNPNIRIIWLINKERPATGQQPGR